MACRSFVEASCGAFAEIDRDLGFVVVGESPAGAERSAVRERQVVRRELDLVEEVDPFGPL